MTLLLKGLQRSDLQKHCFVGGEIPDEPVVHIAKHPPSATCNTGIKTDPAPVIGLGLVDTWDFHGCRSDRDY